MLGVHHRPDVRIPAFVGDFQMQVLSHRYVLRRLARVARLVRACD